MRCVGDGNHNGGDKVVTLMVMVISVDANYDGCCVENALAAYQDVRYAGNGAYLLFEYLFTVFSLFTACHFW